MATIAENIQRIQDAKADIKTAIEAKGVTVPSSATIDTYPTYVSQIPAGGGDDSVLIDLIERDITEIVIPSGTTSIGEYAFYGCGSLSSVTIPSGVTRIGNYAFQNCSNLTGITIPSGVTSIGQSAFQNCSGSTEVTIPNSVIGISNYAFRYCSGLTSVTVNATTPPTLGTSVFNNTNNCPIYVPSGSVETYKTDNSWSTYADRIQAITD